MASQGADSRPAQLLIDHLDGHVLEVGLAVVTGEDPRHVHAPDPTSGDLHPPFLLGAWADERADPAGAVGPGRVGQPGPLPDPHGVADAPAEAAHHQSGLGAAWRPSSDGRTSRGPTPTSATASATSNRARGFHPLDRLRHRVRRPSGPSLSGLHLTSRSTTRAAPRSATSASPHSRSRPTGPCPTSASAREPADPGGQPGDQRRHRLRLDRVLPGPSRSARATAASPSDFCSPTMMGVPAGRRPTATSSGGGRALAPERAPGSGEPRVRRPPRSADRRARPHPAPPPRRLIGSWPASSSSSPWW